MGEINGKIGFSVLQDLRSVTLFRFWAAPYGVCNYSAAGAFCFLCARFRGRFTKSLHWYSELYCQHL